MIIRSNPLSKKDIAKHFTLSLVLMSTLALPGHSAPKGQKQASQESAQKPYDLPFSAPQSKGTQTIEQVLAAAYEYNSNIKEARAALRGADEAIAKAKSGYRPQVNLLGTANTSSQINSGTTKNMGTTPSSTDNKSIQTSLEATQNIFQGWNTDASVAEAESNREAALFDLVRVEQKAFSDTVESYLTLLSLAAEVKLLKAGVNLTQEQLNSAQAKFKVGEETRTSVAQAQGQLVRYQAQLASKEAQLEGQKATFTRLTGLAPGVLTKPKQFTTLPKILTEAVDIALVENPEIKSRKHLEIAAEHAKTRVTSGLWPKIDLKAGTSYGRQEAKNRDVINPTAGFQPLTPRTLNNQTNTQATMTVSVPLYEGGSVRSDIRHAHEDSEKRRVEVETKRRETMELLTQQWANLLSAKANIEFYQQQVKAYETSLEGTRQEMLVGTKILLDVLDEQSKLTEAQQNLVKAEKDYYTTGFQLMASMGRLTSTHLNLPVQKYDTDAHYQEAVNSW